MKKALFILLLGLFTTAVFAQTKTEVKPGDLAKPVTDYIMKNYSGFTIDKAFKVDSKGVITWDVIVSKDKLKEKLEFDKDGKFIKQITMNEKPASQPAHHTQQTQHSNTQTQSTKK
jgi:hypothetical protein